MNLIAGDTILGIMKKFIIAGILLVSVFYAGKAIYSQGVSKQLAQVSGSTNNITNGQLLTTSVAQGGTITFKLVTNNNVPLTDSQLSKLYIEPIGPNKPIMTITRAGTDTYTARIPTDFPVGSYEISVFPRLNSGTEMNWYFNETLTVTAAPVVVTPPTVVTPPVVPPVVTPPVVVTPPAVNNQAFSMIPPPDTKNNSDGLNIQSVRASLDTRDGRNSIQISWTTTKPTYGFVDYGTAASYGKTEKTKKWSWDKRELNHSIRLVGIAPNTTYHFRIRAETEEGVKVTTADGTFFSGPNPGWMSIVSPNRNVVLQNNKNEKIFWWTEYQTLPIDLYLAGGKLATPVKLKSSNAGHASFGVNVPQRNGQETIKIPSTTIAPPGWGYYISIRINNTEVAKSESFEVAADKGPIVLTVPTKTLKKGETYTVTRNRDDAYFSWGAGLILEGGGLVDGGIDYGSVESRSETSPVIKTTIRLKKGIPSGKYVLKLRELNTFGIPNFSTITHQDVVVTD